MLSALSIIVLTASAIILIFRAYITKGQNHWKLLPPGPRGLPMLGNVLQLSTGSQLWLTFDRWKYEFGPIVYLNMAGQHIVVLNSKIAATELLERRSALYSDRPKYIVADYLGGQLAIPFARYGKLWQSMRRAGHAVLNSRISPRYHTTQTDEAVILAHSLLYDRSTSSLSKIQGSASTIISVVYGKPLSSNNAEASTSINDCSPELHITSNALDTLSNIAHRYTNAVYPGAHLVEVFPILDLLPDVIAKWKRKAKQDFKRISDIFEKYFADSVQDEHQRSSLCVSLASEKGTGGLTSVEQAWVAGSIAVAAVETTSTTLSYFLYAMILHPNVQVQAHRELDKVVGRDRNPTFADRSHLPYIRAIVKEVLRWQPAIPLAVPHILMEDDWYEGYFIPKGTSCIPNVWSMNRDREIYGADADEFRPERFLRQSESKTGVEFTMRDEYEADYGHCAYGFGRRICVGRHVADNALFIDICIILWALRIEPKTSSIDALDRDKREPSKDILNPIPELQCTFRPRFPEASLLLHNLHDEIVNGGSTIHSQ